MSRYAWQAVLDVDRPAGKGRISLRNRFDSEALVLGSDNLLLRDENLTVWTTDYPVSGSVSALLKGRTNVYSQNRVLTQDLLGGVRWMTSPFVTIEPVAGFAWDRRSGIPDSTGTFPLRTDAGPAGGFRFQATPKLESGNNLLLSGNGVYQNIAPRTGYTARAEGIFSRIQEESHLDVTVRYANLRRDTYQPASFLNRDQDRPVETIEATIGDTLQAIVQGGAPVGSRFMLEGYIDFTGNNRFIRTLQAPDDVLFFDTDLNRRSVNANLRLAYVQGTRSAQLGLRWGAELENRRLANRDILPPAQAALKSDLLRKTNFDRGFLALQGGFQWPLTNRSTIRSEFASSILRHDTPDSNPDDRDEVFHSGELRLTTILSRYLQINTEALVTWYHTVYLKADRSAENNIQRTLRLRPAIRWLPDDQTNLRFTTEIRAAYTVEDFVLEGRRPNDQSARELRYELAAERLLDSASSLLLDATYSDLRLGRLLWDSFAEIPFDTVQTTTGWLRVQTGNTTSSSFGFRWFVRSDFERAATVRYPAVDQSGQPLLDEFGEIITDFIVRPARQIVLQLGPSAGIRFPLTNGSAVQIVGWLQWQQTRYRVLGTLPETDSERIRDAARKGTLRIIPNLSLNLDWRL